MTRSPPQPLYAAGITASPDDYANNRFAGGARLWMRFDRFGQSELVDWDENTIVRHVSIPARDMRIFDSGLSHSSNIFARRKAMVVKLAFIKAVVTAEEVLVFDPLRQEVLPFVEKLMQQLPGKSQQNPLGASELPFEFQVLGIVLETVCTYLDSNVADLERGAYPVLDELTRSVSIKNLEHVRTLKTNMMLLLTQVEEIRDGIKHSLSDKEYMTRLYLTRKLLNQQLEEVKLDVTTSDNHSNFSRAIGGLGSHKSETLVTSHYRNDNDVVDLEMLLDTYFNQLDETRNKLLSVRKHIHGIEEYVSIRFNKNGEEREIQLTLQFLYSHNK
ncbi:hypothetical protein VNO80_07839 [Phaseolus coccineus]|uniref:Magnesium transporter n=1 Tax=Phaseolus coccineus TaxID=3886 RepID=A0AAN9NPX3_PHACN